jgi:type II secretory pathway pseudopilin PulG
VRPSCCAFPVSRRRPGLTLIELLAVLTILIALAGVLVVMSGVTARVTELDATFTTMMAVRNAIMGTPGHPGYYQDMTGLPIPPNSAGFIASNGDPDYTGGAGLPWQMLDLFQDPRTGTAQQSFDPFTRKGWRGPYLSQTAGNNIPLGQILDGWPHGSQAGKPILIQWPPPSSLGGPANRAQYVRLVSFGADGVQDPGYAGQQDPTYATNYDPSTITPSMYKDDLILYLQITPTNSTNPVSGPWTNYYDLKQRLQN